nr:immunoglobulin heavy chain junction region [Mus musculus]MBK4196216.1 immunoglobulin heavy chain junction region [Mus musculus]MBK4197002.1 immunoglobulin heavy chain junction region [Mus musculus]
CARDYYGSSWYFDVW